MMRAPIPTNVIAQLNNRRHAIEHVVAAEANHQHGAARAIVPKPAARPRSKTSRMTDQSLGVASNATAPFAARAMRTVTGVNRFGVSASVFGGLGHVRRRIDRDQPALHDGDSDEERPRDRQELPTHACSAADAADPRSTHRP